MLTLTLTLTLTLALTLAGAGGARRWRRRSGGQAAADAVDRIYRTRGVRLAHFLYSMYTSILQKSRGDGLGSRGPRFRSETSVAPASSSTGHTTGRLSTRLLVWRYINPENARAKTHASCVLCVVIETTRPLCEGKWDLLGAHAPRQAACRARTDMHVAQHLWLLRPGRPKSMT